MASTLLIAIEYAARVREFSPSARLFLAAATLGGIGAGVSAVLLNLYIVALGYTEGDLLRILSFGPLGAAAGAILSGPLIDLWGTKRSMLAGTALSGAGALALLLSPTAGVLRLGLALSSLGAAIVYVAYAPFLSRHSSARERAYLFGMTAAAYVVSTAAGRLIGGVLPELIGAITPSITLAARYRDALFAGVLLSGLGLPLLAAAGEARLSALSPPLPRPLSHKGRGEKDRAQPESVLPARGYAPFPPTVGERAGDRGGPAPAGALSRLLAWVRGRLARPDLVRLMMQFVVFDGLIRLGANLVVPLFNVYFVRHLGASEAQYGVLASAERATVVAATLLAAPLAMRLGPVLTVMITQLLSVPMLLALGFAPSLAIAAGALLARGALMEMTVPTRDQFLMEMFPEDARATANATLLMAGYGISFVAHRMSSRLLDAGQLHTAFVLTGSLYVASALLYWLFFHLRPQAAPGRQLALAALAG